MSTPTLLGQRLPRPAQCPIQVLSSQKCPGALSRHKRMEPVPANRGPSRPKPERRGEAGELHISRVRLQRVRGGGGGGGGGPEGPVRHESQRPTDNPPGPPAPPPPAPRPPPPPPGPAPPPPPPQWSPLRNMSDMMLPDARIPNPGPTVLFSARGRRLTPKAKGHAWSLSAGPGLGVSRHPHPRQSRAAEPEPGSTAWRGRAARGPLWRSASAAQSSESRREGPRAPAGGTAHLPTLRPTPPGGDPDPGAEQAGGPGPATQCRVPDLLL